MRTGNAKVIESLLSTRARQEIVEKGLDIAPIGSPQARFEIGAAQLADPKDPNTVLVSSNWYEPGADGQIAGQYEVVWALIKEATGWRICEMAVDTHQEGEEIQVVNFENLSDLAPKDSTSAPPAGPATSTNPANEPARTASLPGSAPAAAAPPPASSGGLPPLPPSNLPALPGGNAGASGLPAIPAGSFPAGSAGGAGGSGSLPPLPPAGFGGGSK
jgi:hypothetical protein